MPEVGRRLLAAAAAGVVAATLAAPAAWAQSDEVPNTPTGHPDRWAASRFDAPFDEPDHVVRAQPFDVAGTLRYEKVGPADQIVQAEVRIVPVDADDLRDGCTLPAPVVVPGPGPQPELTAELRFEVTGLEVSCNASYLLQVEATLDDPTAPTHTLEQPFDLGSLPPAVTDLSLQLDEPARRVAVTFTPVPDDELDPDAVGYVLERGGPAEGVAAGTYSDRGAIDLDDEPRFVDDLTDAAGGTYTYRVRAVRAGADEPERSSVIDTESATITIGEPPDAPPKTVVTSRGPRRGSVSVSRRSSAPTRRVTVTTLDTGFEDTIDYGELPDGVQVVPEDLPADEPVAGQSVITEEGEGVDLAAPVAGALVLLGWAGHIAYLNRLARQLSLGP